ncbi:MAG TPA: 2OG-Fe(II) oxygenase [Polyangia bacterium]|jgi:prolyl 4-hydroxylase|nr:2OG-Fe(II) oxygenase [Polyangia bacterium]
MSASIVRFRPELSAWLTERLDQGLPPSALAQTMVAEHMQPAVADAIVAAFVRARRDGRPAPTDTVVVDGAPAFRPQVSRLRSTARLTTTDGSSVRVLARAERPCLALLGDLLSAVECDQLIALARPRLAPSTVVDPQSGLDVVAGYRNSQGMFFRLGETAFIDRLDRRFSEVMNQPLENGESLQVLCYSAGGATAPHFDFLLPSNAANQASIARSGQRTSTLLCYLNDVAAGGETIFPRGGWSITPRAGHAVYFENTDSRGQLEEQSLHAGGPVAAGEKWVVTKWMRQKRFIPLK